jgi:carboxylesterase type B
MSIFVDPVYGTLAEAQKGDLQAFRGIPVATPPVGTLRLRAPESPEAWRRAQQKNGFADLVTWEFPVLSGFLGACHRVDMPFVLGAIGTPAR